MEQELSELKDDLYEARLLLYNLIAKIKRIEGKIDGDKNKPVKPVHKNTGDAVQAG